MKNDVNFLTFIKIVTLIVIKKNKNYVTLNFFSLLIITYGEP